MKTLIPICVFIVLIHAVSLAEGQEIRLEAPEGWNKERIVLPPQFAPKMRLQGVEEIRFAPGMFRAESDSFFSYVLVFQLKPEPKLDASTLQKELLVYYRGLAAAVLKNAKVAVDPSKFTLKLKKSDAKKGARRYEGELNWIEPFVTRKSQTLHLEVDAWSDETSKYNYVFICASPKKKTSAIWKKMRSIRDSVQRAK